MRIDGTISVQLTVAEAALINALLDRDEPMEAKVDKYGGFDCPVCGRTVHPSDNFCENCGQSLYFQKDKDEDNS